MGNGIARAPRTHCLLLDRVDLNLSDELLAEGVDGMAAYLREKGLPGDGADSMAAFINGLTQDDVAGIASEYGHHGRARIVWGDLSERGGMTRAHAQSKTYQV